MGLQERLESDLKTALLGGDKKRVEVLKGIKNAIQYEAVSLKVARNELGEEQIQQVLAREAKKRQEAAELYRKVGETERTIAETLEKDIIEEYLPDKLSEEELQAAINEEVGKLENPTVRDMGKVIGAIKGRFGAQAEGSVIAQLVKRSLETK